MNFIYEFDRPMVSVDTVVFDYEVNRVLLIRRKNEPFKDMWAIPGGFLEMHEELIDGAARELLEETGIRAYNLQEACVVGTPFRDPRGRVISVVYTMCTVPETKVLKPGDDALEVKWFAVAGLPQLAADHNYIIQVAKTFYLWR